MTGEQIEKLIDGRCPDCDCIIFRPGPRGGIAQNIECVKCLSRFNVARYNGEFVGAHRIPNDVEWREDMFPKVLE